MGSFIISSPALAVPAELAPDLLVLIERGRRSLGLPRSHRLAQLLDDLVVRNGLASIGVTRLREDWHRLYPVWRNNEVVLTCGAVTESRCEKRSSRLASFGNRLRSGRLLEIPLPMLGNHPN